MPVRLRITLLFSFLVFIILVLVCVGVYYFSYQGRINTIKTRLTNRAITTARLLSQKEVFDHGLVQRIDSSTTISLKNKTVQAYDKRNEKIYNYSDLPGDTLIIGKEILREARQKKSYFFLIGDKEAIAYQYADSASDMVVISAAEDEEGKKSLHALFNILLFSFLISNIFVLVCGYIFSKGLLLPVKKITEDVAEISAQNLARRIYTGKTKDEWYQLSDTLNSLINRLQESFELQGRFISNASHELSTPLTAISSQLEVSLQRPRAAEEYKKVMQSIYQDVQHMNKLTQTLLEFAKASGNPGGLDINLIRLDEIILSLPAEVAKINASFSVKIEFNELPDSEEKLLVFGNEALLATAIKNIVLNACKYSEDHTAMISLKNTDHQLVVSIEDNGIGIADGEKDKIFQPFYRIEENQLAGGFGLGLSLAERIIKIHKGTIQLQSKKNGGTVFIISLPCAQ